MSLWNQDAFIGGHPAIDFANTVEDQDKLRETSRISDWVNFLGWAKACSIFNKQQIHALEYQIQQIDIPRLLENIHELRETQYAALSCIVWGKIKPNVAMQTLEAGIKTAISNSYWVLEETGYKWAPNMDNPRWVIDVLTLSIEDLLRFEDITKLKECGRCTWMFLNKGRGRGRQWCNMSTCGNRAKSASFRNRQQ
ncbi:MAG: hypothetical protein OFPI_10500 [Osedax symbiont Rs2]|nr:MAG: hypothetical protein OFPI_10500 [Osedax symbiont Rs2]